MLSVIIPSRTEEFLNQTIQDVLDKATGEIEVFPVLDGYDYDDRHIIKDYKPILDPRVKYIHLPNNGTMQKRQGINAGVSIAKGEYVMSLDAHCMMDKGFDEKLAKDCDDDWVVIPRRLRLHAEDWTIEDGPDQPPIDYEYWMHRAFIGNFKDHRFGELHGYKWNQRTIERKDILIDETMTIQASCWFMKKKYFNRLGLMQVDGYTGWGQEAEEICLKTWTSGGKVMTNKKTWYAHLHKGGKWGRMYYMTKYQRDASIKYSYDFWVNKNRKEFAKVINHFMPIPNWTEDWEKHIWTPEGILNTKFK